MIKKIKDNQDGFTLVELLVVLVIIGILASMVVPAFTGYIRKEKEREAIQECKQVVASAENYYKEKAVKNQIISLGLSPSENKEVVQLAGVTGVIKGSPVFDGTETELNPTPTFQITQLSYKASNGIGVKYDIAQKPYYILEDTSTYAELDAFNKTFQDTMRKLYESGKYTLAQLQSSREIVTGYFLEEIRKTNPNYLLPEVDPALMATPAFANYDNPLYWQPYYISNGSNASADSTLTVLFATPKDGSNTAPNDLRNNWNGFLIYVNGQVFESTKTNYNGTKIEGTSIANMYKYHTEEDLIDYLLNKVNPPFKKR